MSNEENGTDEEPAASPEIQHENLFEVRVKELKACGKRTWLHRLYLVASLDLEYQQPDDIQRRASLVRNGLDEFGSECEQQVRRLHTEYREEQATGFLLIYPKYMIHMLESSEDTIVAYLRSLRAMLQQPNTKLREAKVLLVSHDIPSRLFDSWSWRGVVVAAREHMESGISQQRAAAGCLQQLLGLASHILKTPPASRRNALDLLSERVPELLPSEDLLSFLLQEGACLGVDEFLDLYQSEMSVVEDSELVWPLPSHVYPYNN